MDLWKSATEQRAPGVFKPFGQPLHIYLADDPGATTTPIFLGFRAGRHALASQLESLAEMGVNHVALQLRFNQRPTRETVEKLVAEVLPRFRQPVASATRCDILNVLLDKALAETFPTGYLVSITPVTHLAKR